jgi:hypothetical protein
VFLQLNPPLPVEVVSSAGKMTWDGPTGTGMAIIMKDLGPDHNSLWTVIMDATGEIWDVQNPFVRGQANITYGRKRRATI